MQIKTFYIALKMCKMHLLKIILDTNLWVSSADQVQRTRSRNLGFQLQMYSLN